MNIQKSRTSSNDSVASAPDGFVSSGVHGADFVAEQSAPTPDPRTSALDPGQNAGFRHFCVDPREISDTLHLFNRACSQNPLGPRCSHIVGVPPGAALLS